MCDAGHALAWERLARASVITADPNEALRAADQLLAIGTDPVEWTLFRGSILARLGRFDEAIRTYDQAVSLNPRNRDAYHQRAHVWRRLGKYREAVADYTKALDLATAAGGNGVWTQYQRATAQWIGGNPEAAAEDYRQARAGPTFYSDARRYIVLRDCGRAEEANDVLRTALRSVPDDARPKSVFAAWRVSWLPEGAGR